ncbi:hypothetical protein N0V83_004785 [Neocucurbitaria cava]|uniref:Uncharacterized protein n=1 Tax=Neocucurbitaria cava TaxID=798079 RepID=A0A9W9CNB3_9PLEO|nr:hypothetical protein N0V83_004785 [Neocucurbitaria cava]
MIEKSDAGAQTHVPATEDHSHADEVLNPIELAKRSTALLPTSNKLAASKPYGRDWDILWLGHCGTSLPQHNSSSPSTPNSVSSRLMLLDDPTVPDPSKLRPSHTAPLDSISSIYPPHTRVYHRTQNTLCTLAYAVTQRGARKILYEHGLRNFDKGYDFALISHFWPEGGKTGGGKSDIMSVGAGGVESGSAYLVRSVRGGLERSVEDEGIEM